MNSRINSRDGYSCAIHQPNFLPRFSTLAKLYAADVWVVLDTVQYCDRDYQNRARLASHGSLESVSWLTIPVRRPRGRVTRIDEVTLVDPEMASRRVVNVLRSRYGSSPHATEFLDQILAHLEKPDPEVSLTDIDVSSTRGLLDLLSWPGEVCYSHDLAARPGRSERLADLTKAVGAVTYLCGTGGRRYLDLEPFHANELAVQWFRPASPPTDAIDPWTGASKMSAVWALSTFGVDTVRKELRDAARGLRGSR